MQCHGLLWPADALTTPQQWPNSPPLVSGKVWPCQSLTLDAQNQVPRVFDVISSILGFGKEQGPISWGVTIQVNAVARDTALSPAAGDTLSAFGGAYSASYLGDDGKALDQPMRDITIVTDRTGQFIGPGLLTGWQSLETLSPIASENDILDLCNGNEA
jgi:hypothetical protein